MSEEEIIKGITNIIYTCNEAIEDEEWYSQEERESAEEQVKFVQGLLDLYNKEKEKNKERKERLQEEINENCILKTKLYGESISKDKIREKIKYYKDYEGLELYEKFNYGEIVQVLKELLEE